MKDISSWLNCEHCGRRNIRVRHILSTQSYRVKFTCGCGFRHSEIGKDSTSNKSKSLESSKTVKCLVKCPSCGSENNNVFIYTDKSDLSSDKIVGNTKIECCECDESIIKTIS